MKAFLRYTNFTRKSSVEKLFVTEGQNADVFNFAKGTLRGRNASSYQQQTIFILKHLSIFYFVQTKFFRLFVTTKQEFEPDFM